MNHFRILISVSILSVLLLGFSCELKKSLEGPGGNYCFYSSADWYRNPNSHIIYPISVEIEKTPDYILTMSSAGQFPDCKSLSNLSHQDSLNKFIEIEGLEGGLSYNYRARAKSGEVWNGTFESNPGTCNILELTKDNMVHGSVEFWCNSTKAKFPIKVIITGLDTGTIDSMTATQPPCGGGPREYFWVDTAGVYNYTAVDGNLEKWTGQCTISPPHCISIEFNY